MKKRRMVLTALDRYRLIALLRVRDGPICFKKIIVARRCPVKLKLHLFDLLWIYCTTSCTANPQQIYNKSNKWILSLNELSVI
jgi:hypothetical protein